MKEETLRRVRGAYEGQAGLRWERIECGRPASYLERNVVLGRERLRNVLLEWLGPLKGLAVLDGGCGLGTLASALAERGVHVTAADLVPGFVEAARGRAGAGSASGAATPSFVNRDFLELLAPGGSGERYDVLLLLEVLEDYASDERREIFRCISASAVPSLYLAFRCAGAGSGRLWSLLPGVGPGGIDAVELLRWVHTHTLYRQIRRQVIHVRNYEAQLSELARER